MGQPAANLQMLLSVQCRGSVGHREVLSCSRRVVSCADMFGTVTQPWPRTAAIPVPSDTTRFCPADAGLCHAPPHSELRLSPGPEPQRCHFRRTPRGSVMQLSGCVMRPRVRSCTSPGPSTASDTSSVGRHEVLTACGGRGTTDRQETK